MKRIGIMMVSYGIHEPEIFKLLFMQEHKSEIGFADSLKDLGDIPDMCKELIERGYGMTPEEAALMLIKSGKVREIYTDAEKKTGGTYHGGNLAIFPLCRNPKLFRIDLLLANPLTS